MYIPGIESGKSTAARRMAEKMYQPSMQMTNAIAPPACWQATAFLMLVSVPWDRWMNAAARQANVGGRSARIKNKIKFVRSAQME